MYGDGVSLRRRHPLSEAGLTANLSNPRVDWPEDHACGRSGKKIRRRWVRAMEVIGRVYEETWCIYVV